MTHILKTALVYWMICLIPGTGLADTEWKLAKDKKGVAVYSRPVPGSELLEFKAVTTINASMAVLGAVLADVPAYPQWMSNCREATILHGKDLEHVLVYYVQTLPWPIANRDVVLNAITKVDWDKGVMEVTLEAAPNGEGPTDPERVRMAKFRGRIILTRLDDGSTQVVFRILADPAGSLPPSGVNAGAMNVPYKTLLAMKNMAAKPKYVKAAEEHAKDRGKQPDA